MALWLLKVVVPNLVMGGDLLLSGGASLDGTTGKVLVQSQSGDSDSGSVSILTCASRSAVSGAIDIATGSTTGRDSSGGLSIRSGDSSIAVSGSVVVGSGSGNEAGSVDAVG